jgi:hypothetical protein
LKQGRNHRFCQGCHQGARNRHSPYALLASEVGDQSLQPGPDAGWGRGMEGGLAHGLDCKDGSMDRRQTSAQ